MEQKYAVVFLLRPINSGNISELLNNLFHWMYTRWPKKNATHSINNFKKSREKIKKVCALMSIELFSKQNDTKVINFDEGVLILWPFFWGNVIFKICHFCLKSHNWRTVNFHRLASGYVCFCFQIRRQAWIKRSIHYVTLQYYNPGEATQRNSSRPQSRLLIEKKLQVFENNIASEKWL